MFHVYSFTSKRFVIRIFRWPPWLPAFHRRLKLTQRLTQTNIAITFKISPARRDPKRTPLHIQSCNPWRLHSISIVQRVLGNGESWSRHARTEIYERLAEQTRKPSKYSSRRSSQFCPVCWSKPYLLLQGTVQWSLLWWQPQETKRSEHSYTNLRGQNDAWFAPCGMLSI